MATYRYVAHDIAHDLKQLYDEAQINLASIVYWMHIVGDFYKRQRIDRYDAYQYLNVLSDVIPTVSGGKSFLTLPSFYDLLYDKGINYIEVVSGTAIDRFSRITVSQLGRIRKSKEEVPSITNRCFYVEGHKLYLMPTLTNTDKVTVGLYTSFDTTAVISLDDEFVFPQDMIPRLKADLLNMGRLVLSMPDNALNDGTANPSQRPSLPTQQVTAPADETQQQNV